MRIQVHSVAVKEADDPNTMTEPIVSPTWLAQFPQLAAVRDQTCLKLLAAAQTVRIKKGSRVFEDGSLCDRYLLILTGSIRVQKTTPGGHEIVLYHVGSGQSCELAAACIIGGHNYPAQAIAETVVQAVSIPRPLFDSLIAQCPPFRDMVYQHVERGISGLVSLVEEVAFGHMDARLAHCLLRQTDGGKVTLTHHQLAAELGSAREVVSRLLKKFESHGWVALHRGHIDLLDDEALRRLAGTTFE